MFPTKLEDWRMMDLNTILFYIDKWWYAQLILAQHDVYSGTQETVE